MRYVNPLVEGSSPSPVNADKTRQKETRKVKSPRFSVVSPSSTQEHAVASSGQESTNLDRIGPLTATPNATQIPPDDPDLTAIIDSIKAAWPLSAPIRAGILAMVNVI